MKELKTPFCLGLVVLVGAVLFFGIAFSTLDVYPKSILAILVLVLTGFTIHKITGVDSFYGFLIVRSETGFDLMKEVAKRHPRFVRDAADWGTTLAFGFPYGWRVFGLKKAMKHLGFMFLLLAIAYFSRFLTALSGFFPGGEKYLFGAAVLVGLAGMGLLSIALHAYKVFTVPGTPPGVQLLIPGVTVPWEAVFAIAIIAIVHEMAHGVLCYVEKLKLKSSGILLLGFLPVGAFVEPDEEKLDKVSLVKKRRILVAGSTSNVLFFVAFFLVTFVLASLLPALSDGIAVSFVPQNSSLQGLVSSGAGLVSVDRSPLLYLSGLYSNVSAEHNPVVVLVKDGKTIEGNLMDVVVVCANKSFQSASVLSEGERLLKVEGKRILLPSDIASALEGKSGGEEVSLETNAGVKKVALGANAKLGIQASLTPSVLLENKPKQGFGFIYSLLSFLLLVFSLTYLLNLLIAVVNLLPLFITDGHKTGQLLSLLYSVQGKRTP
ncbi:site-2 protease family protein [Candidatus Micrarchaeota archaeon]|nr:site-2 protease family protein [Candidatus Micrarchaeota archaeon]